MAFGISMFVLFHLAIVLYVRLIGPTGPNVPLINTINSYPPHPFQYIKTIVDSILGLMFQLRVGCKPCIELWRIWVHLGSKISDTRSDMEIAMY